MDIFQAVVLGVVQGLTEFVPISSSGHLVVFRELFSWPDPGLAFDAILHLGTFVAVIIALWSTWARLARVIIKREKDRQDIRLVWFLILGTIPAGLAGWFLGDLVERSMRGLVTVAALLLSTGIILVFTEIIIKRRNEQPLSYKSALVVGLVQVLALLPGISRSGITIAAGVTAGLTRKRSAEFSFLLSAPVILGAGLVSLFNWWGDPGTATSPWALLAGFVSALAVGFVAIRWLLKYLQTRSLTPFSIYLFGLGIILLILGL